MSCFVSCLNELINKCNAIAHELVDFLIKSGFMDKVNANVYSFNSDLNLIEPILYDGETISNSIIEYYVKEYSKCDFHDVFIKGVPYLLNEIFVMELGLPCLNLQGPYKDKKNLLIYWYSIFNEHSLAYTCCYERNKQRGYDIIYKYYKRIETEQNKYNHVRQEKKELAQYALELYNKGNGGVEDYIVYILTNSFYFFHFECNPRIEYNETDRFIVVEYYLPQLKDIPCYIYKNGKRKQLSQSALNKLYDDIIYKIILRSLAEIFHFDSLKKIDSIFFNGRVVAKSSTTGKDVDNCVASICVTREKFEEVDLNYVDAKACFKYLKGISASKIYDIAPITPILTINKKDKRFIDSYKVEVDEGTNLAEISWEDFEHLVREIFDLEFNVNGGEVKITQSSRDGGVDAIAFDPDPIRGGKIVIQAKRYTNTVGVSAVRDLYGTIINEGANKGILITTSDYGSDSYKFAMGKPITLLNGGHLLFLMQKHGKKAHINIEKAKKNK